MKQVSFLVLLFMLVGCGPKKQAHPTTISDNHIVNLVNQLVIPKYDIDNPKYKNQFEIARKAHEKLVQAGFSAFPTLCQYLDDERNAISSRAISSSTVGETCFQIIAIHLYSFPIPYTGSMIRQGSDGEHHFRPYFGKITMFEKSNIQQWLEKRKSKSLTELQIEVLQHVIEQEKKIGSFDLNDEDIYIKPLVKHLASLSASLKNKR
ncbi:MAG: hypothetical protein ACF8OB_19100 [Phycisphaeraceae bacterium JB051]